MWKEIEAGNEWIVDADLKDFFGSADHENIVSLVSQQVSDGRVLRLIEAMLKAGSYGEGRLFLTERGTPQGSGISPLLSNILLTPFDREMRRRGYQLTRYSDDWVMTCSSAAQARAALETAGRVLKELGVQLHPRKTRIVHVRRGFEFLGHKIKRGSRSMRLSGDKIKSGITAGVLYARPTAEIGVSLSTSRLTVRKLQSSLQAKAKMEASYRFYSLWDKICRADVLREAFRRSRVNAGAPGVDGVDFEAIDAVGVGQWLGMLEEELRGSSYAPQPLLRVWIPKQNGGQRPLSIPTVKDRVVQTAVVIVLGAIFDADLRPQQYGFRPGLDAKMAVRRAYFHITQHHRKILQPESPQLPVALQSDPLTR